MQVTQFDLFVADLYVVSNHAPIVCTSNEECAKAIKQRNEAGNRALELIADNVTPGGCKTFSDQKFNALRSYLFMNVNPN